MVESSKNSNIVYLWKNIQLMQKLMFILSYPLILLISKLPFSVIYQLSNIIYYIVYHFVGYRKDTVRENLKSSFPNHSETERKKIEKKFYRHFCDLLLETIKVFSISKYELKKRFHISNPEVIQELENKDKSVIYMCSHYNNYEWILALRFYGMKNTSYGIYKKLKNKAYDQVLRNSRSRFETYLIDKVSAPKKMSQNKLKKREANYGMIADQSPKKKHANNWLTFLHQNTPVYIGSELLAKRLDFAVVYMRIEKVNRGYYKTTLEPITTQPKKTENGEITLVYFKKLEEQIKQHPEFYLWTHKRWKHKDKYNPEKDNFIQNDFDLK